MDAGIVGKEATVGKEGIAVNEGCMRENMSRVGQNRIYTPYMTVYLVIFLPKKPYTHRIYMVLASPKHEGTTVDAGPVQGGGIALE